MKKNEECVRVSVRCRPFSQQEIQDKRKSVVSVIPDRGEVLLQNPKEPGSDPRTFTYDITIDENATQESVYNLVALPIVEQVLQGYNGTIFAYGQTGTGKTFTMEGIDSPEHLRGIIPRAFDYIFNAINGTPSVTYMITASFLELYNEEVRDLLSKSYQQKLELRENPETGVYVKDLSTYIITKPKDLKDKLEFGRSNRHVGQTKMNQDSSRSHSIFTIRIDMNQTYKDKQQHFYAGKLNLVDLAGSERQSKTESTGERFREAISINLSLATLGNVISALVDNHSHIPYRDSKLTRLLQDSLGGNTKTVMIANIGPTEYNYDETLSTLRYAYRAKSIKNKPHINEDPKDAMIRQFQQELARLQEELSKKYGGSIQGGIITKEEQEIQVESQEETFQEYMNRLKQEKQQILEQANIDKIQTIVASTLEEQQKLKEDIKQKRKRDKELVQQQKELTQRIREMKNKLVVGSNIQEQKRNQERQLIEARIELEEREQRQRRLDEELKSKQQYEDELNTQATTIQGEISTLDQKIQIVMERIKNERKQTEDIHDYRMREKEVKMEESRSISSQLKLSDKIIANFIDTEQVNMLKQKLKYSDEIGDWQLKAEADAPQSVTPPAPSAYSYKQPLCEYSRISLLTEDKASHTRHKDENLLTLNLDFPQATTIEFDGVIPQKCHDILRIIMLPINERSIGVEEDMPNVYIENPDAIKKEDVLDRQHSRLLTSKKKKNTFRQY